MMLGNSSGKSFLPQAVIREERPMIAVTGTERFGDAVYSL
jgi:hypothetical protein